MTRPSVTDLMLNFAAACRALVPALDFARVPYRDSEQYDNWDRVVEPLFRTLVTEPCAFAAVGEALADQLRIAEYGFSDEFNNWEAYVALCDGPLRRFIQFSTTVLPFDQCQVVEGHSIKQMPLAEAQFVFVFAAPDGTQQQLATIDLEAV